MAEGLAQDVDIESLKTLIETQRLALAEKERELAEAKAEIARISTRDELSGSLNRPAILGALEEAIRRSSRYGRPLALVLFDFDHFKLVNDIHGREAGDEAIRRFSALCLGTFRNTDLVGRYGGEEFLAILPEVEAEGALVTAERVRAAFQTERFRAAANHHSKASSPGEEFTVTASAGVAAWEKGFDSDRFLARADAALRRAKEKGRNRVELALHH